MRDTFVVAWHHWRKISGLDDPETWARPHAWPHAQRRHTARLWHRDKRLDPDAQATLDALGQAHRPPAQGAAADPADHRSRWPTWPARSGLPLADAERELQTATAQFAVHREVPTTSIRTLFEPLRQQAETVRWPRATIIRRSGAARRRTHTAVGVVATVAALVLTGSLVTDAAGLRPSLAGRPATAPDTPAASTTPVDPLPDDVAEGALLTAAQVAEEVPGRGWTVTGTDNNSSGDGLVLPCQQARYADGQGVGALIRSFETRAPEGRPRPLATHATEVSGSPRAARKAYATTLGWYAGCQDPRVQLLSTRRVEQVGDAAMLLVLRDWDRPVTTLVVGIARTGLLTTTTLTQVPGTGIPNFGGAARLLATAVDGLCTLPDAGACAGKPELTVVRPLPVGQVPGMLAEVDLPPVTGVDRPWVGTEPRKAVVNVAATRCDEADFSGKAMTNNITRSFLIPKAKLPVQFGLTQTVGSLPAGQARAFVDRIRSKMASCSDRDLGTEVRRVLQSSTQQRDLTVWHVTIEISDRYSVIYLMGIVRTGTSLAQIGFVPDRGVAMPRGAFSHLAERALDRLEKLPPPRKR